MGMLCFKNGSLAREDIAKELCNGDWKTFGEMLNTTPPGNNGNIGFYYPTSEITPTTGSNSGFQRFDSTGNIVNGRFINPAHDVRAVVESKFLAMRYFGERIGMDTSKARRIIATGGASNNLSILQVLSDVFGCPVYTIEQSDSASLGAAFRALHGHVCYISKSFVKYEHVIPGDALGYTLVCSPKEGTADIYATILPRFETLQEQFTKELLSQKVALK